MVIVDTDILIDAGRDIDDAVSCLSQIEDRFAAAISSITWMELIVGCGNKTELHSLELFLERFQIIHTSEKISDTATQLLKKYRLSHGLLIPDALIAATALITEIPLISKNLRDYVFIDNIDILSYPKPF